MNDTGIFFSGKSFINSTFDNSGIFLLTSQVHPRRLVRVKVVKCQEELSLVL